MAKFQGRNNRAAKLTQAIVDRIREEYAQGNTQRELSRRYSVSAIQIGRIVRLESWLPSPFASPEKSQRERDKDLELLMQTQREINIKAGMPADTGLVIAPKPKSALQKMQEELRRKNPDALLNEITGEPNDK